MVDVLRLLELVSASMVTIYAVYYIVHSYVYWYLRLSMRRNIDTNPSREPRVAIVVPIYNDPAALETLPYLYRLRYRNLVIVVVDDSSDESLSQRLVDLATRLARENGIQTLYLRRKHRYGYKAGALNTAISELRRLGVEYVLILDADHILTDRTLRVLVAKAMEGYDIVQGYQRHVMGRKTLIYDLYRASQGGAIALLRSRAYLNLFPIFYGSTALIRLDVLEDVSFRPWCIAEDFAFTVDYAVRRCCLRIAVVEDAYSYASVPENLRSLVKQQIRWSAGTIRVFLDTFRDVIRSQCLGLARKIDYVLQGLFFTQGLWILMHQFVMGTYLALGINPSPASVVLLVLWALGLESILFTGALIEGFDRGRTLKTLIVALLLINFFALIHTYGTILGLVKRKLRFEATRSCVPVG